LAAGNNFGPVTNGMLFPLKIDGNDVDPVVDGDDNRSLIVQVGTNPFGGKVDLDQEWVRPHTWGIGEVVNGPEGIANNSSARIYEYKLFDNYPNPFNPYTTITYTLKESGKTTLKIYNSLGQEIATLVDEVQAAGPHVVKLNAGKLASGVYFYRLDSGSFHQTKKMVLMK